MLEAFNSCDIETKGSIIFDKNSLFLGFRQYYGQRFVLYDCGEFFAEVCYDPESNKITNIEGFPIYDKRVDRYIDFMSELDKVKY